MKRADNIAATDSAINYAVSTVSLVRDYYILFSSRGQDGFNKTVSLRQGSLIRSHRVPYWSACDCRL